MRAVTKVLCHSITGGDGVHPSGAQSGWDAHVSDYRANRNTALRASGGSWREAALDENPSRARRVDFLQQDFATEGVWRSTLQQVAISIRKICNLLQRQRRGDEDMAVEAGAEAFDYIYYLTLLEPFRVPAPPAPGPDARLAEWRWPPLRSYNGFDNEIRVHVWQLQPPAPARRWRRC